MNVSPHEQLTRRLAELQAVLSAMSPQFGMLPQRVAELLTRLKEERFRLAILGQFKRGKSSLMNALLGEPLLPTGIVPLTTVPTLLRDGLEIIDTPGIGSTILENTRAARAVLPVCDGALFILSPDPAITEVEIDYLRAIQDVARRIIFIMTKADLLAPHERTEALDFLRDVLRTRTGLEPERIFPVSARFALEARERGDETLWQESGLEALQQSLADFAQVDKRLALCEAVADKAARLIKEVIFTIELQQRAIELPRQELERRSKQFDEHVAKIDLERMYFKDRLDGDRRRLLEDLDEDAEAVAAKTREVLGASAQSARAKWENRASVTEIERGLRATLSQAVETFFAGAAVSMLEQVTARFRAIQDRHCGDMEVLIDRVRRTAADLFEVPSLEGIGLDRLETIREARIFTSQWITSFTEEATSWLTRWLPRAWRLRALDRRLKEHIEYLVRRNVEELRWTIRQNMEESARTFQARMEANLEAAVKDIQASVLGALARQSQREAANDPEIRRLTACKERLGRLLVAFLRPCPDDPQCRREGEGV